MPPSESLHLITYVQRKGVHHEVFQYGLYMQVKEIFGYLSSRFNKIIQLLECLAEIDFEGKMFDE